MIENEKILVKESAGRPRGEAGFSFIDLMLALVILTIGILALADLQIVATKGSTAAKSMTAAVTIAEAELEATKGTPYADIQSKPAATVTSSGLIFTKQVTVTNNSPVSNSKTVNVTVTWSEAGATRTIPMSTVISQQ